MTYGATGDASSSPVHRPVAWRPLALPPEHGGWGLLLEPIALGLLVAPSAAGVLLGCAAVAAFLVRHPLRVAVRDRFHGKRHPRTTACQQLAAGYMVIAVSTLVAGGVLAGPAALLPCLAAAPLAATQFLYDVRNEGRKLYPQIAGGVALAMSAAAIAIAGGQPHIVAFALWLLMAIRSAGAVVHVRATLRRRGHWSAVAVGFLGVGVAAALWRMTGTPAVSIITMLLLLIRTIIPTFRVNALSAKTAGLIEIAYGVLFVMLIAAGYRNG